MSLNAFLPIFMLLVSNTFMTFAWYGQLKFPNAPLWLLVVGSWLLAFVEYCFAIPANKIGAQYYSLAELKTIQEVATLVVFSIIAIFFFDQKFTIQHIIGFSLIALGAGFIFYTKAG